MRKKAYLLCCWRLLAWWQGFELSPSKLPTSAADVDKKTTEKHTGFCSCGERFYFDNCSRCRKFANCTKIVLQQGGRVLRSPISRAMHGRASVFTHFSPYADSPSPPPPRQVSVSSTGKQRQRIIMQHRIDIPLVPV